MEIPTLAKRPSSCPDLMSLVIGNFIIDRVSSDDRHDRRTSADEPVDTKWLDKLAATRKVLLQLPDTPPAGSDDEIKLSDNGGGKQACCAKRYLQRAGCGEANAALLPRPPASTILLNGLVTLVGMLILSFFEYALFEDWLERSDLVMLIGSQGATSVLVFDAFKSPLARPWNVVAGNMVGAAVGVSVRMLTEELEYEWLGASLAVAVAIMAMDATGTLHPPGGASALIAVIGSERIKDLGYW
jgi:hypothetical protein